MREKEPRKFINTQKSRTGTEPQAACPSPMVARDSNDLHPDGKISRGA
jgi:hypothetical protein